MALINTTTTGVLGTTVFGDGQGALTVQKDGVTQGIFGNQPAFSVYLSSSQTVSGSTWTKVAFNAKLFDTNSNWDSTNYRFIPNIAGYYQINGVLDTNGANSTTCALKKNGNFIVQGSYVPSQSGTYATGYRSTVSGLIYCNGTTDYIELFGYSNLTTFYADGGIPGISGHTTTCEMHGVLVRAA